MKERSGVGMRRGEGEERGMEMEAGDGSQMVQPVLHPKANRRWDVRAWTAWKEASQLYFGVSQHSLTS